MLDTKVKKEMFSYETREICLVKSDKGYAMSANEGFEFIVEGLEGMTFPTLNNFKQWLKLWANRSEEIIKSK